MPAMPSAPISSSAPCARRAFFPPALRFQISIPMVNSVVRPLYFPDARDFDRVRPGFEESLAAEIDGDRQAHSASRSRDPMGLRLGGAGGLGRGADIPREAAIATHVAPVARLSRLLPEEVAARLPFLLRHVRRLARLRAGDARPRRRSRQRGGRRRRPAGRLGAHPGARHGRRKPSTRRSAGSMPEARDVYLGAIHSMADAQSRASTSRANSCRAFGLAAYCGFGRTPPGELPQILDDHRTALKIAGLA